MSKNLSKFCFVSLFLLWHALHAQTVFHKYLPSGLSSTTKIYQALNGYYYVSGNNWTVGQPGGPYQDGGFFTCLDETGEPKWRVDFGAAWLISVKDILVFNHDKSCVAIGKYYSASHFFTKCDSLGNVIWSLQTGVPMLATSGAVNSDTDFVVAGRMSNSDYSIMKLNEGGTPLWGKSYTKYATGVQNSAIKTNDKGFFMCGDAGSVTQVYKTDSLGNLLWSKLYSASTVLNMVTARQTKDSGYIMCGGANIIRTDATGNVIWSVSYPVNLNDAQIFSDSLYFFCGYSGSKSVMLSTRSDGTLLNATFYADKPILSSVKYSSASSLVVTNDKKIVVGASARIPWAGNYDAYRSVIIRTDTDGTSICGDSSAVITGTFFSTTASAHIAATNTLNLQTSTFQTGSSTVNMSSIGCFGFIGIEEMENETNIGVWPNPSEGEIFLRSVNKIKEITVTNTLGQQIPLVTSGSTFDTQKIDLSTCESGVYVIQIKTSQGIVSKKLILNR